ncbi:vanadium-dependent haloperoxidase [Kitasatospora sp. NPDC004289]
MNRTTRTRRSVLKAACSVLAIGGLVSLVPQSANAVEDAETSAVHRTDHVIYWNNVLMDAFRTTGGTPGPLGRGGAMMNLAIYDAVNSIQQIGRPYRTLVPNSRGYNGSMEAAIDQAAYSALKAAFPAINFDDELNTAVSLRRPTNAININRGIAIGNAAANGIITDRVGDGADDNTPYVVNNSPGYWRPTPGSAPVPHSPNWGKVKPFGLLSGSQFRPTSLPFGYTTIPAFIASPEYAAGVDEVRRLGGATSTERTADQTEQARYWANDVNGTYKPIGHQYVQSMAVYQQQHPWVDSAASARLFAMISVAMADAAIAIWDSKFDTENDLWRPESAINFADTDNNPLTTADPNWRPLSMTPQGVHFSPPFPTYVSGHSGIVAAWAGAMKNYFGCDNIPFSSGTDDPNAVGVVRHFNSFTQAAQEKANSRLYAGVHFRWDNQAALEMGYKVAAEVNKNVL